MSTLQQVKKTEPKAPRIIIYGEAGLGKSTFGAGARRPIFIPTEDGLGQLNVEAFPLATTYEDIIESIGELYTGSHDYETVVLDSLDWLEPLIWNRVCEDHGIKSIEGLGYGKGYIEALRYWRAVFEGLTALRDERGMVVLMTAHSQIMHIEDPTSTVYDMHTLKLHKRAGALAEEFADVVGFAAVKVMTKSEDTGFNNKRTRAITTGERLLHVDANPAYTAKTRYTMPGSMELSWASFENAMQGEQ